MIYLGDTEMQLSHPEAAAPLLESSLRIDTGRELAHLDLGILYNDAGRRDDALRELKIAEQLSPTTRMCIGAWDGFTRPREGKRRRKPSSIQHAAAKSC